MFILIFNWRGFGSDFPLAAGHGLVRVKPGNCLLPSACSKYLERINNMKIRSDDIFVLCWAKSGTTWTQEMVWCICNNFDLEAAKASLLSERVPWIDRDIVLEHSKPIKEDGTVYELLPAILSAESPRILKSHLPLCLLPPKLLETCKVVMCLRNPKDVVVSYYYHQKLFTVSD